uniref:Mediator of RNA polymerase II transcription subunit 28 n=1 Tax=Aquila chrysaetos chrysaetos TaxID=223781 RepID=A0A663DKC5_AQUCH
FPPPPPPPAAARHGGLAERHVRQPAAGPAAAAGTSRRARAGRPHPASDGAAQSQQHARGRAGSVLRGVDQCIQKFLDVARQTECFFLQKRLQLSVQKPEQVIKEDVSELRNELQRKEALIQKHLGKLRHWQQVLEDISVQHKKPAEMPQGPLAYLEQAPANIPAPMKQT